MAMDLQTMDSIVKHLRCNICDEYLIRPPVLLLGDGSTACGNCSASVAPKNPDDFVVREMALELVLHELSFPCNYKSEGCQERLFFGYLNHKAEDCVYRPLTCPTKGCLWSGCMYGVQKHFDQSHSAMVKKALNFKLEMERDFEETILAVIFNIPIVAKCVYNAEQRQLLLKINSLTLDEVVYKIWMWNDRVPGSMVSLKNENCVPYTSSACDGLTLNLEKYLPALEEPQCIMVSVGMVTEKTQGDDADIPSKAAGVQPKFHGAVYNGNMGNPKYAPYFPVIPITKTYRN